MQVHTYKNKMIQNEMSINLCIHTYIHTHVYTYAGTYVRTYVHAYIHTYIHAFMHTLPYVVCDVDACTMVRKHVWLLRLWNDKLARCWRTCVELKSVFYEHICIYTRVCTHHTCGCLLKARDSLEGNPHKILSGFVWLAGLRSSEHLGTTDSSTRVGEREGKPVPQQYRALDPPM